MLIRTAHEPWKASITVFKTIYTLNYKFKFLIYHNIVKVHYGFLATTHKEYVSGSIHQPTPYHTILYLDEIRGKWPCMQEREYVWGGGWVSIYLKTEVVNDYVIQYCFTCMSGLVD